MKFEIIGPFSIKVQISNTELQKYNLSYETFEKENPNTKSLLAEIFRQLKNKLNINISNEIPVVEVFKTENNSIVLYISSFTGFTSERFAEKAINRQQAVTATYLLTSINNLYNLISLLHENSDSKISESELYYNNNLYYLIVTEKDNSKAEIKSKAFEFCEKINESNAFSDYIREHSLCLIQHNAINSIYIKLFQ